MMREPVTDMEWQDAVDAAEFALHLESARHFGVVEGCPEVDVARAEDLLARGRRRGVFPTPNALRRYTRALVEQRSVQVAVSANVAADTPNCFDGCGSRANARYVLIGARATDIAKHIDLCTKCVARDARRAEAAAGRLMMAVVWTRGGANA